MAAASRARRSSRTISIGILRSAAVISVGVLEGLTPDAAAMAAAGDGVVYWTVLKGATLDSALGTAQAPRRVKERITTRNVNTLEKVCR